MPRREEARAILDWAHENLPHESIEEARQVLRPGIPAPEDPELLAAFQELALPGTGRLRRIVLLRQIFLILRDG